MSDEELFKSQCSPSELAGLGIICYLVSIFCWILKSYTLLCASVNTSTITGSFSCTILRPSSCNHQLSILVFFTVYRINLLCWIDNNQLLNYHLSKTLNNFHYNVAIKTKLNNEFIVLYRFLWPKQHETINSSFCIIFKPQNNTKQ